MKRHEPSRADPADMTSQPHRPIRDQIRQAIDPENKLLPLFDAVDANPSLSKWLPDLAEYLGGRLPTRDGSPLPQNRNPLPRSSVRS